LAGSAKHKLALPQVGTLLGGWLGG